MTIDASGRVRITEMFESEKENNNKRDCVHYECPYKYCKHHKYWNGKEQNKLSFFEKNNISNSDEDVEFCMCYMDI